MIPSNQCDADSYLPEYYGNEELKDYDQEEKMGPDHKNPSSLFGEGFGIDFQGRIATRKTKPIRKPKKPKIQESFKPFNPLEQSEDFPVESSQPPLSNKQQPEPEKEPSPYPRRPLLSQADLLAQDVLKFFKENPYKRLTKFDYLKTANVPEENWEALGRRYFDTTSVLALLGILQTQQMFTGHVWFGSLEPNPLQQINQKSEFPTFVLFRFCNLLRGISIIRPARIATVICEAAPAFGFNRSAGTIPRRISNVLSVFRALGWVRKQSSTRFHKTSTCPTMDFASNVDLQSEEFYSKLQKGEPTKQRLIALDFYSSSGPTVKTRVLGERRLKKRDRSAHFLKEFNRLEAQRDARLAHERAQIAEDFITGTLNLGDGVKEEEKGTGLQMYLGI